MLEFFSIYCFRKDLFARHQGTKVIGTQDVISPPASLENSSHTEILRSTEEDFPEADSGHTFMHGLEQNI